MRSIREKISFYLIFVLIIFTTIGCINDLTPSGGWSGFIDDGDYLYLGKPDGQLIRLSKNTGDLSLEWRYPVSEGLGAIYGTPRINDDTIFSAGYNCRGNVCNGRIFAVDLDSGEPLWTYPVDTKLIGSPGVNEDVLVIGTSSIGDSESSPGYLLALDISSESRMGRELWRLPVAGPIWGGIVVEKDVAYFGTLDGTLYSVDISLEKRFEKKVEDRVRWTFRSNGAIAGTPLIAGGKILFGTFGNSFYSLDLAVRQTKTSDSTLNPAKEWIFNTKGWVWAQGLISENVLFVSTLDGIIYALDPVKGINIWANPANIEGQIVARPATFESNRGSALAVPSGDGGIHVVIQDTGEVSGMFETDGRPVKSTPIVLENGLYVHTVDGQIRRYQTVTLDLLSCLDTMDKGKRCD